MKLLILVEAIFSSLHHDIWLPSWCLLVWGSCCWEAERGKGKASFNVGCCVIPPRAPLLFLCLCPHVIVGYFLWWLARINRSSNVHPASQQLHDWWDFTSLIYLIIVAQTWGERGFGLCSVRSVTCDCGYGTWDYSNVRFVWGFDVWMSAAVRAEALSPSDRALSIILLSLRDR